MIIKRKLYSKYDETDEIKRMKDSDILAAEEKHVDRENRASETVKNTGRKALTGAAIGAGLGLLKGDKSKAIKFAKIGALTGGGLGLIQSNKDNKSEADDIEFYNRRLRFAKKNAKRREARDWRENMTQREGYSY